MWTGYYMSRKYVENLWPLIAFSISMSSTPTSLPIQITDEVNTVHVCCHEMPSVCYHLFKCDLILSSHTRSVIHALPIIICKIASQLAALCTFPYKKWCGQAINHWNWETESLMLGSECLLMCINHQKHCLKAKFWRVKHLQIAYCVD